MFKFFLTYSLKQKLITSDNTNAYKRGLSKHSKTKQVQEEWTVELQCKQFPKCTFNVYKIQLILVAWQSEENPATSH